ncbi:MAG: hypothetical protein KAW92_11895 [Candidatus Cloacimonetes bacterium]|nr:hypothetical protein [Candidatus Cloacimonadota bacterium]
MFIKGYKQTEEHKRKIGIANKGKKLGPQSEEHRKKIGEAVKIFTKKQELQICNEYFSEKKPNTYILAKRWGCVFSTIGFIIKRNGYKLRTKSEAFKISKAKHTPEAIQRSLKNGHGTNCYYNNEFFPSLQERDCYIKLKKLGFKVKHNFEKRFDFLINDKIVLEYHPCNFGLDKRTAKQYYTKRRKLLNEYGYKDLKLVVIKDLKEIENKLGNKR